MCEDQQRNGLPKSEEMSPMSDYAHDYQSPSIFLGDSLNLDLSYSPGTATPGGSICPAPSPSYPDSAEAPNCSPPLESSSYPDPQLAQMYPEFPLDNSVSWKFENFQQPAPQFTWEGPHPNMAIGSNMSPMPDNQFDCFPRQMPTPVLGSIHEGQSENTNPPQPADSPTLPSDHEEEEKVVKSNVPYARYIWIALMGVEGHTLRLAEIYQWFRDNTTKWSPVHTGWQNSIRHNLSMNAAFKKDEGNGVESKKSTRWMLEDWAVTEGVKSTTRYRKNSPRKTAAAKRLTSASAVPRSAARDRSMTRSSTKSTTPPALGRLIAPGPSADRQVYTSTPSTRFLRRQRYPRHLVYNTQTEPMPILDRQTHWVPHPMPSVACMPPLALRPQRPQRPRVPAIYHYREHMAQLAQPVQHPLDTFGPDPQQARSQRLLGGFVPGEQQVPSQPPSFPDEQQTDGLFTDPLESAGYMSGNYTWAPVPDGESYT